MEPEVPIPAEATEPSPELAAHAHAARRAERRGGWLRIAWGLVLAAIGIAISVISHQRAVAAGGGGGVYVLAHGPILGGALAIYRGMLRLLPHETHRAADARDPGTPRRRWLQLAGGVGLLVLGVVLASRAFWDGEPTGPLAITLHVGPIVLGLALIGDAISRFAEARWGDESRSMLVLGYKSFVAWRYLLVYNLKVTLAARICVGVGILFAIYVGLGWNEHLGPLSIGPVVEVGYAVATFLVLAVFWGFLRHSRPAVFVFVLGFALMTVGLVAGGLITPLPPTEPSPFTPAIPEGTKLLLQVFDIVKIAGAVLMGLAMFFGAIRAFFTFFTTVPIGGVWIGTAALVCVLAVMSGFETDLRDKILGSNAHIQVTREDGDFNNWREVKARIDKIPGIVASTPYAVSEVVIAANNNGMNVIIKGIDPENVGRVTDLVSDLEDPDALKRLAPLVDDSQDRLVPEPPRPKRDDLVDPPPDDMSFGGDPIDFSGPGDDASRDAGVADAWIATDVYRVDPDTGTEPPLDLPPDLPPDDFGTPEPGAGSAAPAEVIDPPPPDLLTTDEAPIDYSRPGGLTGGAIYATDVLETTMSRRTQSLPGILVGRELVKQTHLYPGEEVRVVSPLSDPSNPDATGTPIPFNRDYRVAGIFYTGMYEYDLKYVYVTLDSLQDFLDRGDAVDGIEIRIGDPDETGDFLVTLQEALGPGYRIADWRELNRNLFSALKLEKIAMFLVLGIVILVASFSIVGNLIMVVIEKARQIALLKTLGASDNGVMQLFAIQGLMIGLIGTVLGIATGLAGCWAGKRFGLPLNPDVYYIDRLPIHVDPASVVAAAAAGVLISIAATFYPALLAARVRPAAGMRH